MQRPILLGLCVLLSSGCVAAIKEQKIRAAFEEIWTERNFSAIDKHYAADVAPGVRQFVSESLAVWPDAEITVHDVVVRGNTFVVEWSVTGHHRELGTEVTLHGVNIDRVNGTTVIEEQRFFDNLHVYSELGYMLVPPEAVPESPQIFVGELIEIPEAPSESESGPEAAEEPAAE